MFCIFLEVLAMNAYTICSDFVKIGLHPKIVDDIIDNLF